MDVPKVLYFKQLVNKSSLHTVMWAFLVRVGLVSIGHRGSPSNIYFLISLRNNGTVRSIVKPTNEQIQILINVWDLFRFY